MEVWDEKPWKAADRADLPGRLDSRCSWPSHGTARVDCYQVVDQPGPRSRASEAPRTILVDRRWADPVEGLVRAGGADASAGAATSSRCCCRGRTCTRRRSRGRRSGSVCGPTTQRHVGERRIRWPGSRGRRRPLGTGVARAAVGEDRPAPRGAAALRGLFVIKRQLRIIIPALAWTKWGNRWRSGTARRSWRVGAVENDDGRRRGAGAADPADDASAEPTYNVLHRREAGPAGWTWRMSR